MVAQEEREHADYSLTQPHSLKTKKRQRFKYKVKMALIQALQKEACHESRSEHLWLTCVPSLNIRETLFLFMNSALKDLHY